MSKKKESSVKQSDKQILWIRAGARCQLPPCNKYLLEDELTGYEVKMADVAHIVGRKDSKKSPRGEHPLPIEKRNEPENLMLLCSSCHNKIIDGEPKEEFSVELLTEYKKSHEDRIRFLTSLTEEHETTIIRLEGRIRGESVNITKEEVRKAVLENFKYPRYYSCEDGICIDLKSISEEIDGYWQTAVEVINDVIQNQMMPAVNKGYIKHLSVFGFSRIPLLIQLGRSLGNKVTTDIYQKSRETQEWQWPSPESNVNFESKTIQKGDNNKVAILLSISGEVMGMQDKHPVEMDKSYTIYEIRPVEEKPHLAIIKSLSTLNNFAKTYRKLQRHIESEHNAKEIMLLPATPLAVSVICGREFLRDVSSSLRVYELQREGYRYTITIQIGELVVLNYQSKSHKRICKFVEWIAPDPNTRDTIKEQRPGIRNRIKNKAKEDGLTVASTPNAGSFEKKTGLRRHCRGNSEIEGQDVDLPFVVEPETEEGEELNELLKGVCN